MKEIYESFGKSIHTAGVGAGLCLLFAILNLMPFGSSSVSPGAAPASGCVTTARRGALDHLEEPARHFVDLPGVAPDKVKKGLPDETDNEVQRSWAFLEDLFVFEAFGTAALQKLRNSQGFARPLWAVVCEARCAAAHQKLQL